MYVCACDCGNSSIVNVCNLRNGNTKSCGCLLSVCKLDDKNPIWKGDKVGCAALHEWVRRRYKKPDKCEHCKLVPPLDLANRSNKYLRDLSDWWYLCRRCHMGLDGRAANVRALQQTRRVKIPPCHHCGKIFYRKSGQRSAKFCSIKCYSAAGGRWYKRKESL